LTQAGQLRRGRLAKAALWLGVLLILLPAVLYLALLAAEVHSAHQASIALARLESLKLGDPVSDYDQATSDFLEKDGEQLLISGAFRLAGPVVGRIWRLNEAAGDQITYALNHAGLRLWELRASSSSEDGKLTRVSLKFSVVGRYTALGTGWTLVPTITDFDGGSPRSAFDRRILISSSPLPSNPPGEGYYFEISNEATSQELQVRQINPQCLLSLHGCKDVCELTPNLLAMLRQRNRLWLETTKNVPPLPCGAE